MKILFLTLMMSFLSHSAFASDSEDGGADDEDCCIWSRKSEGRLRVAGGRCFCQYCCYGLEWDLSHADPDRTSGILFWSESDTSSVSILR